MKCEQAHARRRPYLDGTLARFEEKRIEHHLVGCTTCWERFRQDDPALRLAAGTPPPRSDEFWNDFWPGIRAAIEAGDTAAARRRTVWSLPVRAAAAVVAVGALAAAIWLLAPGDPAPRVAGAGSVAARPSGPARPASQRPTVESYPSARSRVHHFILEETDGAQTEIILIFDESIDL